MVSQTTPNLAMDTKEATVWVTARAATRGLSDRATKKAMLITDLGDKLTLSCDLLPT